MEPLLAVLVCEEESPGGGECSEDCWSQPVVKRHQPLLPVDLGHHDQHGGGGPRDLQSALHHVCREDDSPESDARHPAGHHRPRRSNLVLRLPCRGEKTPGGLVRQEEEEIAGHLPGEGGRQAPEHPRHSVSGENLPGELGWARAGRLEAPGDEGLPHGLQATFHQLGGTESQGGPEGGEEAGQPVVENAELVHLVHTGSAGHEFLAGAVGREQNAVLGHVGRQGGNRPGVETSHHALLSQGLLETQAQSRVELGEGLHLHLQRVQGLPDIH